MQHSEGSSDAKTQRNTIVGLISCGILLCICIAGYAQRTNTSTPSTQAQPKPSPTKVKPTSTPIPLIDGIPYAIHGSLTVGGTLDAFVVKYGAPTMLIPGAPQPSAVGFIPDCGSYNCLVLEFEDGLDGKHYVSYVSLGFLGGSKGLAQAQSSCELFLPKDTQFVRENQATTVSGLDYTYTSTTLAKTFPTGDFPSSTDIPVPNGTLSIEYNNTDNSTLLYSGCVVTLGG